MNNTPIPDGIYYRWYSVAPWSESSTSISLFGSYIILGGHQTILRLTEYSGSKLQASRR